MTDFNGSLSISWLTCVGSKQRPPSIRYSNYLAIAPESGLSQELCILLELRLLQRSFPHHFDNYKEFVKIGIIFLVFEDIFSHFRHWNRVMYYIIMNILRAGKIRCTLVSCACRAPKVASRRTN